MAQSTLNTPGSFQIQERNGTEQPLALLSPKSRQEGRTPEPDTGTISHCFTQEAPRAQESPRSRYGEEEQIPG